VYFSYVVDRPDSVLAALRTVAQAPGAALVHCAAGKDRTGTLVALALSVADAERQAIIDDYAASSERVEAIVDRLLASPTYADNLRGRPISSHMSHPETMISFLRHIDDTFGGVLPMLIKIGWTAEDTDQLRAKLRS
jgi:protein-tyrosine phosphatase